MSSLRWLGPIILTVILMSQVPSASAEGSNGCRWVWSGVAWVWQCQASPAQPPKPTGPSEIECVEWRTQLNDAREREAAAQAMIDQLDRAIADASVEISVLAKQRTAAMIEINEAQQALATLEAQLTAAMQKRDRAQVATLQPLIAAARTRLLNANNNYDNANAAFNSAQQKRSALLTEKEAWVSQLVQAKAEQARLKGLLSRCR